MKAMILAAGRGERMRPLTDSTPKPLLAIHGRPLIQHHIESLKQAGITDIVVNVSWLKDQLIEFLGDGSRFGVDITLSEEPPGALETAGGIVQALDALGDRFIVVNSDVYTDFDFTLLENLPEADDLAHLVLVGNPAHNATGDFTLRNGRVFDETDASGSERLTFAGIGVYRRRLFSGLAKGERKLAPLLREAMAQDRVSGSRHQGYWIDIGTPERLAESGRR